MRGGPTGHGPTKTLPVSEYPPEKRGAGATAAAIVKRAIISTKSAEWSSYYSSLVECGYDCVQTACSCVASPRVELVRILHLYLI